jgi:hypothetical protein
MNVGYFENVFVALVSSMHYTCFTLSSVACPALSYYFTLSHKRQDFRKKLPDIIYVFWPSLQLCLKHSSFREAFYFIMRILKNGNSNTISFAYTSFVRPILEYGVACWNPYMEGKKTALDRLWRKAAKFANHTRNSVWENLAQCRKIARIFAPFKAYSWERAWMESSRGQVTRTMLPEQGWSW